MPDNYQTSPPDPLGATFRSLIDADDVEWPAGLASYTLTVGTPNILQLVTPTAGLPVQQQTGSTFAVSLASVPSHDVTNAGTFAVQVSNFPSGFLAAQAGTWNVGITNSTLAVTQSGTWNLGTVTTLTSITNPVAVTGTFWQATQPVSGPLTDTELRATPVPVSGTITTGGLTDAQLRATPVPVSGTISTGGLTDTQLRASAVPVSLASVPSHDVTNAGTFAVQVSSLPSIPAGTNVIGHVIVDSGTIAATQSGTWNVGTVTTITNVVHVDDNGGSITVDGSISVSGVVPGVSATSLGKAEDSVAADGDTGVAVWAVRKDTAATTVGADGDYAPFEVDANGRLWVNGSSVTQPVSNAGTFAVQAAQSGTWNIGTVTTLTSITNPVAVTGTFWQATQPVSGTVASTQSGTWNVGTVTTVTAVSDAQVQGKAAEDAPLSGNPVRSGVRASAATPSAMSADGDVVTPWATLSGALIVGADSGSGSVALKADPSSRALWIAANGITDHDAVYGLRPIAIGAYAKSTAPSAVSADGDLTNLWADLNGRLQIGDGGGSLTIDVASGGIASGAIASGAIASGAIASGAVASGAFASGSISDGAMVTIGSKADAKSTATDTTAITIMQVLKQISASCQAPPSSAVTAVSGAFASGSIADGAMVTLGAKADAKNSATDTTAITVMQVLKQISASVQAPPSQAVTNAGTFAVQDQASATGGATGYHLASAATTNATVVKASAGTVYSVSIFNTSASPKYVKLYDSSSAPTAGSGTILQTLGCAGANTLGVFTFPKGLNFATGIAFVTVTTLADSGSTAVGANDLSIDISYK